jgi:predicted nucleotidyltransferase
MMIAEQLQPEIKKAVLILKDAGAGKVYIFGSALTGKFNSDSDIDLGISGLPPESFFSVYSRLASSINRNIDLVDFDKESDFFNMLNEIKEVEEIG